MSPVRLSPDEVENIVLACCSLHNFLRFSSARHVYILPGSVDAEDTTTYCTIQESWRTEKQLKGIIDIERQGSNNYTVKAKEVRDYLCEYFQGALPWHDKMI